MQDLYWKNIRESASLFTQSIHRLTVKSGYSFHLHRHHNFHEAVLVLQGQLNHSVNGKSLTQEKGQLLYLPNESSHSLQSSGAEFLNVLMPLDWLEDGGITLPAGEIKLIDLSPEELQYLIDLYERFSMNTEHNLAHIQYFRMILTLAEWILTWYHKDTKEDLREEPDWMTRARRALASGEWRPESVQELADLCHISPEHLSRSWKNHTGRSPVRYLNDLKLEKAARLLQISNHTIEYVAEQAGFDSAGYFFQKFRQRYSMSPAQYRRQHRRFT